MTQIRVEGARELSRVLRKLPPEYRKELASIHKKVAEPVADTAQSLVPRRSGDLAASIRTLGSQRVGRVAAGKRSVVYAGPIHYGWPARNIEPQPFLTDALDKRSARVVTIFFDETERLIDKVWAIVPGR